MRKILPLIVFATLAIGTGIYFGVNHKYFNRAPASEGKLPKDVYHKTHYQTFNNKYYFALRGGKIWYKPNRLVTGIDDEWKKIGPKEIGVPHSLISKKPIIDHVEQIGMDGTFLAAIDSHKNIYYTYAVKNKPKSFWWEKKWGAPIGFGKGHTLAEEYKNWVTSFNDFRDQRYYVDEDGNKHITWVRTIYSLMPDGQTIRIADPWTPSDWGYQICGPKRGKFISKNISASGSTVFLINEYGDMYTEQLDFDILGANPFMSYSYEKQKKKKGVGSTFRTKRLLPIVWNKHTKIPGNITDQITIYSHTEGKERTLRVEGECTRADGTNVTGYWEKRLSEKVWKCHETPGQPLIGQLLKNSPEDRTEETLGESKDYALDGSLKAKSKTYKIEIPNFNLFCSPSMINISLEDGTTYQFPYHHRFGLRSKIENDPGYGEHHLPIYGSIEIPKKLWKKRKEKKTKALLKQLFGMTLKRFIKFNGKMDKGVLTIEKNPFYKIKATP